MPVRYLDQLSLATVFLATVLLLLAFNEIGFRVGARWQAGGAAAPQAGGIMAATLGLFAFMLAFTFGIAGSRFDARKHAVLDEANAIGTTWLRSELLPAPYPAQIEPLLRRYVDVRLEGARAKSPQAFKRVLAESTDLHERLWKRAIALGREHPRSIVVGLFIDSLNDVIDLHEVRITVARARIPRSVWLTLYFIAFTSCLMVGVNAGLTGRRRLPLTILLIVTLSAVMLLIIDLDRPGQTLFGVSQQPLIDLQASMKSGAP